MLVIYRFPCMQDSGLWLEQDLESDGHARPRWHKDQF